MSGESGPKRRSVPLPATGDLPRVGKVRLGYSVDTDRQDRFGNTITRAVATEYFVVTDDDQGVTNPESAASFHELYPGEPRVIQCVLPASRADQVMEGAWRLYGTGKLKRKCDGETCDERTETGGWAEQPCVCKAQGIPVEVQHASGNTVKNPAHCRLIWTLNVLLPGVQGVGVWQVETQSEISARRLANWLRMMEDLVGDLRMLPFELHLVPVQVAPDGRSKTVYVLEPRATAQTQALIGSGRGQRQLDAGDAQPGLPPAAADEDVADYANADQDPVDADPGPAQEQEQEQEQEHTSPPAGEKGKARLEALKQLPTDLEHGDPERFHAAALATIRQVVTEAGIPWKTASLADDETWERVRALVEQACLRDQSVQQTLGGGA